jgi:hypothetical protein
MPDALYFFSRAPHEPQYDWFSLEKAMLEQALILPADGENVPRKALLELSFCLFTWSNQKQYLNVEYHWRSAHDVIMAYKNIGALPQNTILPDVGMNIEMAVEFLRQQGVLLDDGWRAITDDNCVWTSPRYSPGPALASFYSPSSESIDPLENPALTLFFCEGPPRVIASANTETPRLPGSRLPIEDFSPFGSYIDFIGAAYEDLNSVWTDKVTGTRHRILDLDWKKGLGIGHRFVMIEDAGSLDPDLFANELSRLTCHFMTYAYEHI